MAQLSWKHHAVIQALLTRGPLKESEFHSIFKEITGKDPVQEQALFNGFLRLINMGLGYVKFELRGCRNQYDGQVYYGVVNTLADEQSKLGTKYSIPQIAYYKAIVEAIIQDITTQGCITNIDALNLRLENQVQVGQDSQGSQSRVPAAFKSFSFSQKEKTLNDLVQDKWLCSTSDGKIGLGVRSFLDLRSWFRTNEIPSCDVCNEAGVKAATCPNVECPIRIHEYCLKKRFPHQKVARVCPGCGTTWHLPDSYEEEEEEEEEEAANEQGQANVPSNNAITRKRLRRVKAEAVYTASDAPSQSASGPMPRRRLRSCKAEAVDAAQPEAEATQSSMGSKGARRSRRSSRF